MQWSTTKILFTCTILRLHWTQTQSYCQSCVFNWKCHPASFSDIVALTVTYCGQDVHFSHKQHETLSAHSHTTWDVSHSRNLSLNDFMASNIPDGNGAAGLVDMQRPLLWSIMNGPSVELTDCVKGKGGAQTVQCTNTVGAVTDLPLWQQKRMREKT